MSSAHKAAAADRALAQFWRRQQHHSAPQLSQSTAQPVAHLCSSVYPAPPCCSPLSSHSSSPLLSCCPLSAGVHALRRAALVCRRRFLQLCFEPGGKVVANLLIVLWQEQRLSACASVVHNTAASDLTQSAVHKGSLVAFSGCGSSTEQCLSLSMRTLSSRSTEQGSHRPLQSPRTGRHPRSARSPALRPWARPSRPPPA